MFFSFSLMVCLHHHHPNNLNYRDASLHIVYIQVFMLGIKVYIDRNSDFLMCIWLTEVHFPNKC